MYPVCAIKLLNNFAGSSLTLAACSLPLVACSLALGPEASASARWRSSASGCQDAGSSDLLCWSSRWPVQYLDAGLSLDPYLSTAAEWFVRAVNNFAGTINCNFMAVVIWFICLHRNDWFVVTIGCITSDYVLIDMYIFFHLYLSVNALVRVSRRLMASYRTLSGLI